MMQNSDHTPRAHGTRVRYLHGPGPGQGAGCRCAPCTQANSDYERLRARKTTAPDVWGPPTELVDIDEELLEHVRALTAAGVGYKPLAQAAGVNPKTVLDLLHQRRRRIWPENRRRILSVTTSAAAPHALIDVAPTMRLIDELVAGGVPRYRIAREALGLEGAMALQMRPDLVTVAKARAIAAYHDQTWRTSPALREVCRCFAAITFEARREANTRLQRKLRGEAVSA